jgi:hypothetical protein
MNYFTFKFFRKLLLKLEENVPVYSIMIVQTLSGFYLMHYNLLLIPVRSQLETSFDKL